jgi:catechol 2,3-dioxygenase-like lactoylglutathione lyase family enzyme
MVTGTSIVAVPVDDIDEALRFFCEVLGMEKRKDLTGSDRYEGERYVEVAPPGSRVALSPYTSYDREPGGRPSASTHASSCGWTTSVPPTASSPRRTWNSKRSRLISRTGPSPRSVTRGGTCSGSPTARTSSGAVRQEPARIGARPSTSTFRQARSAEGDSDAVERHRRRGPRFRAGGLADIEVAACRHTEPAHLRVMRGGRPAAARGYAIRSG